MVVSPEYRLVPEVTVVEQIADCVAVADWLGGHAEAEFGSAKLLIGGISAGGHLAAATLVVRREMFAGALLDCGAYDLGMTPSVVTSTNETLVLTHDWLYGLLEIGLPGYSLEQRRVPSLSPALADLAGMPPALFTVGNLDPLRDDSLLLAGRWRLAGGRADLDVWPEGAHAFTNMATPLGELALDRSIAWIDDLLGETGAADPATVVKVVVRFVNSGTQTGPFMGVPASGRRAEWLGIGIYRVVGGRITEAWFGEDILGMLLQLDAVTLGV